MKELETRLKKELLGKDFCVYRLSQQVYEMMKEYVDDTNYDLGYRSDNQSITITYKRHPLLYINLKKKRGGYHKEWYSDKMYNWYVSDLTCVIPNIKGLENFTFEERIVEINNTILEKNKQEQDEINVGAKLLVAIKNAFPQWNNDEIKDKIYYLNNNFYRIQTEVESEGK